MNIILVMIPLALLLLIIAAVAFFWATNHGQFDDTDTPSLLPMADKLADDVDDADDASGDASSSGCDK